MVKEKESKTLRIIDANFNRLKEGLRVCEDLARFILDDKTLTNNYKRVRHDSSKILEVLFDDSKEIIRARDIIRDVGKKSTKSELKRNNFKDIFFANIQRVKESIRVIEEFSKLNCSDSAKKFKNLRYKIYELEKKTFKKLETLSSSR